MVKIVKESILRPILTKNKYWIIGTILSIFGLALKLSFPSILTCGLKYALEFSPGSKAYQKWVINKEPYIFDVYFFNWTNSEEIYNPNVKPKFKELGPYRFQLFIEKSDIISNSNGTTTYMLTRKYNFIKEEETKELSDIVTIINPVPLSISYQVRNWNLFMKFGVSVALRSSRSPLVISKSVEELLFQGFHDPILDAVSKLPFSPVIMDKFGFMYKKNYTEFKVGPVNFHTLVDDQYGQLHSIESQTKTNYFNGNCGLIKGGVGEFVEMNRNTSIPMHIFAPEICSYTALHYDEQFLVKGVYGDKYIAKHIFDNGTIYPENKCFCNGECLPSGVLNVSSCQQGAPVFLSLPHFLQADPSYRESIEGMNPDREKHNVFATYERLSGVVTAVALRMQINLLLQPIRGLGMYSDVPRYLMPIFHINQTILMTDEVSANLYLITLLPVIADSIAFSSVLIGIFLIACGIRQNKKRRIFLEDSVNPYESAQLKNDTDNFNKIDEYFDHLDVLDR